ncbi:MAG: hypothetical protein WCT23_10280, partial [Candidatus Neomarinimicrobiota bacterium]
VAKEGNYVNVYKKHTGGIVGEESNSSSPSRITKLVNKMFNVQGNEQIVKALKNELFVPQSNLTKFFIPNMQNLLSSLTPQISVASASSGNQTININIAEVKTEDKNSMNKFFTTINRSLANLGQR